MSIKQISMNVDNQTHSTHKSSEKHEVKLDRTEAETDDMGGLN